ncbi:MAG: hypothetical protein AAF184_05680 [Pseudomonadota bacterium]
MRLNDNAALALALGFTYGTLAAKALKTGDTFQGVLLLIAGITLAVGLWRARGSDSTHCLQTRDDEPMAPVSTER